MDEESWPENVVRSRGTLEGDGMVWLGLLLGLGKVVQDGPRAAICADCGKAPDDGLLIHMKPETYAVRYQGEIFYLERHIGIACGCAAKRGLIN